MSSKNYSHQPTRLNIQRFHDLFIIRSTDSTAGPRYWMLDDDPKKSFKKVKEKCYIRLHHVVEGEIVLESHNWDKAFTGHTEQCWEVSNKLFDCLSAFGLPIPAKWIRSSPLSRIQMQNQGCLKQHLWCLELVVFRITILANTSLFPVATGSKQETPYVELPFSATVASFVS